MGKADIELVNLVSEPASDSAILAAAIAFAGGANLSLRTEKKTLIGTDRQRKEIAIWLDSAFAGRAGPVFEEYITVASQLIRGVKIRQTIEVGAGGVRLGLYREFKTIRGLLAQAAFLVLDRAYEVHRCKLESCRAIFISKQDPTGGRPSRVYCCKKHMDEHHNSSGRRFGQKLDKVAKRETLEEAAERILLGKVKPQ